VCSRVLQVHPTRLCNLTCLHCYSRSSPKSRRDVIPGRTLSGAIRDAARLGYNVLGVSGGEPLLYPELREILSTGRAEGMLTTVTSNGMLLDERRVAVLNGLTTLLAISLDGMPESHNAVRGSPHAFRTMERNLDIVRASGIPFGFIFTLTLYNVHELDWVARFAVESGAGLLQIHPLEIAGRAEEAMSDARPDEREAAFAYLETARIQREWQGRLRVQLDLADRTVFMRQPARILAESVAAPEARSLSFADIVSPLVIEPDGHMVPLQYGFPRAYGLGSLHDQSLREAAAIWVRTRGPSFRQLCQDVYRQLCSDNGPTFLNWYEAIEQAASTKLTPSPPPSRSRVPGTAGAAPRR
jgi:Fe-coproporphyrin III synthase